MELDNEIYFNPVTFANVNLPPTERYGVEVQGRWLPTDTLDLSANYTYAIAEFRGGEVGGDALTGKTVPLVSKNKANAQVLWRFLPPARFLATVSYVGEQFFDGDATNTFGQKIPSYTLVNLSAGVKFRSGRVTALLKSTNVLNRTVQQHIFGDLLRRSVTAELRLEL
jgi:iron complex outermembrane receptor protein